VDTHVHTLTCYLNSHTRTHVHTPITYTSAHTHTRTLTHVRTGGGGCGRGGARQQPRRQHLPAGHAGLPEKDAPQP